jgi:Cof subfamily protein (haloacid dehalogenase superfamily)
MKYKLIASDMDGTLLTTDKKVSERTINAIKNAISKGAVFAVSSGRPLYFCDMFENLTGIRDIPFILYNGAKIAVGPDHEIIHRRELSPSDALWLINEGNRVKTTVIVWANDLLYVNEFNERTDSYQRLSLIKPVLIRDPEELVKNGASKVLWFDTVERAPYLHSILDNGEISRNISYYTSHPQFMEIVDRNCSKALALEALANRYGIRREEVIAVGDGYNDLPMLEWAGLSVAVANAEEAIKEQVQEITASNDEDGVAMLLEKYF